MNTYDNSTTSTTGAAYPSAGQGTGHDSTTPGYGSNTTNTSASRSLSLALCTRVHPCLGGEERHPPRLPLDPIRLAN